MPKYESSPKIELHKFFQIKILSHIQRNFEKSNIEIVRRVVSRRTYARTIHALDDSCVIYDIAS